MAESNPNDEYGFSHGELVFYYGTYARNLWNPFAKSRDNNGNALRQIHYAPLTGGGFVVPQLDDYNNDLLNRIKSVSEQQQSQGGQWASVIPRRISTTVGAAGKWQLYIYEHVYESWLSFWGVCGE